MKTYNSTIKLQNVEISTPLVLFNGGENGLRIIDFSLCAAVLSPPVENYDEIVQFILDCKNGNSICLKEKAVSILSTAGVDSYVIATVFSKNSMFDADAFDPEEDILFRTPFYLGAGCELCCRLKSALQQYVNSIIVGGIAIAD